MVDFNPLMINVPVDVHESFGDVELDNNWMDAQSLLEKAVREKVAPLFTGEQKVPYLNVELLPVINRLIWLNMNA